MFSLCSPHGGGEGRGGEQEEEEGEEKRNSFTGSCFQTH